MQVGRGNYCVQREQLLHVHVLLLLQLVVLLATMGQPTMIDATTMKATLIATASAAAAASAATERQPEAAAQPGSIKSICKYTLRHTHTHTHGHTLAHHTAVLMFELNLYCVCTWECECVWVCCLFVCRLLRLFS